MLNGVGIGCGRLLFPCSGVGAWFFPHLVGAALVCLSSESESRYVRLVLRGTRSNIILI
jgi:hypothetical protein